MGTKELSATAYLIAWGRAADPALSLDPYAHLWLTGEGIAFGENFAARVTPLAPYFFCLRSRYFVQLLKAFESAHPGFTLINVGAGLTSYPFLLSSTTHVINLDQEHVIAYYRDRVAKSSLPKREIVYRSLDLNSMAGVEAFGTLLSQTRGPVVVLFEGILTYLDKAIALQLLRVCAENAAAGSRVVAHVAPDDFVASQVWNNIERFFDEELGLPAPRLTYFSEKELTSMGSLRLIEHVGYRDMARRFSTDVAFPDDQLIDERFFLFEQG